MTGDKVLEKFGTPRHRFFPSRWAAQVHTYRVKVWQNHSQLLDDVRRISGRSQAFCSQPGVKLHQEGSMEEGSPPVRLMPSCKPGNLAVQSMRAT